MVLCLGWIALGIGLLTLAVMGKAVLVEAGKKRAGVRVLVFTAVACAWIFTGLCAAILLLLAAGSTDIEMTSPVKIEGFDYGLWMWQLDGENRYHRYCLPTGTGDWVDNLGASRVPFHLQLAGAA